MADTRTLGTKTIFAYKDRAGAVEEAAEAIRNGGIVAIPTETVYGLAANAFDPAAVSAIFRAKGRPNDNPLIVHISDRNMLENIAVDISPVAYALMDAFWPGPLSLVLKKHPDIPREVSAGLDTVAVRMPQNELTREIIGRAGVPLAAPSANISGRPSPTTALHVFEDLCGRIPLIIDGGACTGGVESTVVDVTGDVPVILRPGGVSRGKLEDAVGRVDESTGVAAGNVPPAPGMKYRHYAPRARVELFCGDKKDVAKNINSMYDIYNEKGQNPVVFCAEASLPLYAGRQAVSLGADVQSAQARLFAALRDADADGHGVILFHYSDAMGQAVKNRIEKAAESHGGKSEEA